ncbi:hypothetical protein BOX37_13485 [Nocardia mangyaensis]|uniref:VOC domain-containing protein n=1 Tax=Nocardia mangyaensis TaxID=2213200 RepID=A0A1J0VS61_9NOCA|nr:VOC family protein [Nocardia mangyaensis]APE34791.1 hypothetical protein BOX37_13485 [Nocardia mangyaensis]
MTTTNGDSEILCITPQLVVRDAVAAARWYCDALGAAERARIALPDGRVLVIELEFGQMPVCVVDEFPHLGITSPLTLGGTYCALHLATGELAVLWQRAVHAGAVVFRPIRNNQWGHYNGEILDPFGHRWALSQHVRDISPQEIARVAADALPLDA